MDECMNSLIISCTGAKEIIVKSMQKMGNLLDTCDKSISSIGDVDAFKYVIEVKNSTSELVSELFKLAGNYGDMESSVCFLKEQWNGQVFEDEKLYFEKYGKEQKKRASAEKRLKALEEMYGKDEIKRQLIEYQKYHNIKL